MENNPLPAKLEHQNMGTAASQILTYRLPNGSHQLVAMVTGQCWPPDNEAMGAELARRYNTHAVLVAALQLVLDHDGVLTGADFATIHAAIAAAKE